MQEGNTGFDGPASVLASGLAQHLVSGAVAIGTMAVIHRTVARVPLPVVVAVWILAGASRGVVGGAFAALVAQAPPQYVERMVTWAIIAIVWMPLVSYLFAQLDLRRSQLREFSSLASQLSEERRRARLSAAQLREEVVSTVRIAVAPLVDEVRASLSNAAERASYEGTEPLLPISEKIESLATQTQLIIGSGGGSEELPVPRVPSAPAPWSLYGEGLTFDRTRPLFASALTLLALCSIYIPDAIRTGGWTDGAHEVLAVLIGGVGMFILLFLVKYLPMRPSSASVTAVLAYALSGLIALGALLILESAPLDSRHVIVAISFPAVFVIAGVMLSSATGVGFANAQLSPSVDALSAELRTLRAQSREREDRVAAQVNELMHGPILGRLSACVMALNFYLAEPHLDRGVRLSATVEGVLTHLDRIAIDFDDLGLTYQ